MPDKFYVKPAMSVNLAGLNREASFLQLAPGRDSRATLVDSADTGGGGRSLAGATGSQDATRCGL